MSEVVRSGDVELAWDAVDKIAYMRFIAPASFAREEDARACVGALGRWAAGGATLALVDCANLKDTDPGWRAEFARFFRGRSGRIAWFNLSPLISVMARMFLLATGFEGRRFPNRDEARAWLLEARR